MKRWHGVLLWLPMVALVFVPGLPAQSSSSASGAPVRQAQMKTRFSDSGPKKKDAANQAPAQTPNVPSACGPSNVSYRVHLNDTPPNATPPGPGKAMVYFIHDSGGASGLAYPTTKMGLDGQWVGANRGDSYFSVEVEPGEHHVCSVLQTSFYGGRVELAHFTAEAGKAYYFRTRFILSGSVQMLELTRVDDDQGSYLAGTFPLSESKTK